MDIEKVIYFIKFTLAALVLFGFFALFIIGGVFVTAVSKGILP